MLMNTATLYRQNAVRGATPVGLGVILYEEVLRSLQQALNAIEGGQVEQRSLALTHVLGVIGYLQAVLDFEKGQDVARKFSAVYNAARERVLQANIDPDAAAVRQLIAEFSALAETWREVDRQETQGRPPSDEAPNGAEAAAADRSSPRWQG